MSFSRWVVGACAAGATALTVSMIASGGIPVWAATGGSAVLAPDVLKKMLETQGGAVLGGLDKVTARVSEIYAPLDVPVQFGSLQITVRKCNKRPPEETPEQTVFVEINDNRPDQSIARIFTGWMFWSSPARNALEHPVYDVWLKDCVTVGANAPAPLPKDPEMIEPGVIPGEGDPATLETPGELSPSEPLSPRLLPPG